MERNLEFNMTQAIHESYIPFAYYGFLLTNTLRGPDSMFVSPNIILSR